VKQYLFILIAFLSFYHLGAQGPQKPSSAEILHDIKKLNVLGSVLYVAAHPDDENTRLIAALSKEKLYDVTYISLTRGDGGQNLIGTEIREQLGVLRTQELLMARKIDGGNQLFSRANDFGYSKTPAETFRIWDKDKVMEDLILAMRMAQPDVMINRFSHEDRFPTHGHHTASAMLSVDAFDLSGKATTYPDQVRDYGIWKPERVFFNTSWFFYGSREIFDTLDKSNLCRIDVGNYLPLWGKSVTEIAAEARSQHKCQGFGMLSSRGSSIEYLDLIKGTRPKDATNIMEGINTTWSRLGPQGKAIGKILAQVEANFDPRQPEKSVMALIKAKNLIEALPQGYWRVRKLNDITQTIKYCLGLYLECSTTEMTVNPNDSISIRMEAVNRSSLSVKLLSLSSTALFMDNKKLEQNLAQNVMWQKTERMQIHPTASYTNPYWLNNPFSVGMYDVTDKSLILCPESPRSITFSWLFEIAGQQITFYEDVFYKKGEPAIGEVFEPLDVLPPVFVAFEKQALYSTIATESIKVTVKSNRANLNGDVTISAPVGWLVSPSVQPFTIPQKGGTATFIFQVNPPAGASSARLNANVKLVQGTYNQSLVEIKYDHIPRQHVLLPAQLVYTPLEIKCLAKKVGYIAGAGDQIPESLRQIGCQVTMLDLKKTPDFAPYDCILVGIRAYNTIEELKYQNAALLDYVKNGGTLVVQYNTTGDLILPDFAPYKLKIGRDRITEEDATLTMLKPTHPLMQSPNQITAQDFEGWVQERGLYFSKEWGPEFTPLLSGKDSGEKSNTEGGLLIADYGRGKYIYTGLSFFRELPAGVPGPMRLLANLMSAGK
jgi:LmbE family N-acetylglucosaminyl deacetylase